jgi:pyruvate kinase
VQSFVVQIAQGTDEAVSQVDHSLAELGLARQGDLIVIVYGSPLGHQGTTNTMRLHRIGDPVTGVIPERAEHDG